MTDPAENLELSSLPEQEQTLVEKEMRRRGRPSKIQQQSVEIAPADPEKPVFDTTTPAQATPIRRFTLADLPRYQGSLFPHMQKIFPHIHERMYGGWLRGCIQDNSCFFICGEATVGLAYIVHDPLDPRPLVEIVFVLGREDEFKMIYGEILRWSRDIGAREVREQGRSAEELMRIIKLPYQQAYTRKTAIIDPFWKPQ